MVPPKITYQDGRVVIRVPLADSRDESALGAALGELVAALRDPSCLDAKQHPDLDYLLTTFHTPKRRWIRERVFFARCARHPSLHPDMLEYSRLVNRPARQLGGPLGHGDCHPAGSFAIVPLVLYDRQHIGALIEHLRGWDMDHESFHPSLIEELLRRHGIGEETLDLLAWRAIESDGQSRENLAQAVRDHDLLGRMELFGGIAAFAERAWNLNRRTKYLPLYVARAGHALFRGRPADHDAWLALFEARGLVFDASDRKPPPSEPWTYSIRAWPDDFEDDDESVP
jgi:hypothetical protein